LPFLFKAVLPMRDSLARRFDGPLPRPPRRAAAAGGAAAWSRAAARRRAVLLDRAGAETRAAIAVLRAYPPLPGRPLCLAARLGPLTRRLAGQRAAAQGWREAAGGTATDGGGRGIR
jgi:hypothetical protein